MILRPNLNGIHKPLSGFYTRIRAGSMIIACILFTDDTDKFALSCKHDNEP